MDDREIWIAARQMIDLYDVQAGWNAGLRADHLLDQGDLTGFHVWVCIVKAIKELQGIGADKKDMRN